jgi:hypothetical protein
MNDPDIARLIQHQRPPWQLKRRRTMNDPDIARLIQHQRPPWQLTNAAP